MIRAVARETMAFVVMVAFVTVVSMGAAVLG